MSTTLCARAWTITIGGPDGRPALTCDACMPSAPVAGPPGVSEIRRHLAAHLVASRLPPHLRTCQCREKACSWHRRQMSCAGPLRLLLIRADHGRTWHLADACAACAAAIPHAATVPEPGEDVAAPGVQTSEYEDGVDPTAEPVEWTEVW
ncbi:hypothetical protein M2160_005445 [Streptomyces sp. SAI-117]|nr:hypothetical protein [Streptomyces sp. SAI-117]